ncbi:hypothetical protein MFLAVUS_008439 [Mucor flavus]|uniref:GPI ethanolamine phosphate transferase 3 n=1 Tax=Mucor flavus TaxID=439312 RepID=A0ABP9Z782_9FUNG
MYLRPSLGLVLITLTCLQVFGLYLFLKGFLLTRQTFPLQGHSYDSWDRFPVHQTPLQTVPAIIDAKQPFKRAVVILIDALRFDFVLDIENATNPYFLNQFPVLQQLQHTQPQSSLLFQFRADPPTTTMQRVKGIMTGSLPTFIDAGANFASSAVGEDHLLNHIKSKFEKIYFFGDDTWVNLFPDTFNDTATRFESDSFKMLDLDSVDNDILKHLWPVMEGDDEWQVAIAHFLGVDHCGHTYGPSDPNMAIKLNQMNGVIEKMLNYIDKDTLLVVMGDHGMSVEGDHGGESVEELMSTLFLYSPRQLSLDSDYYRAFFKQIHQQRASRLGYDIESISTRLLYDASKYPIVAQIHLVPTLAYLLQVPIPFGNLGAIIPDVIYPAHDTNTLASLLHMVQQFRVNALQVFDYLNQYADQTHQIDFSTEKIKPILRHLYTAEEIMVQLVNQPQFLSTVEAQQITQEEVELFDQQLKEAILAYDAFLISTIKYCEAIWAQFDTGCMFVGIVLLGFSSLASFLMMMFRPHICYKKALGVGALVLSTCLVSAYVTLSHLGQGWFEKMESIDWIGASAALAICCIFFMMKSKSSAPASVFWYTCDWYLLLIADVAQSFTLGSNSYVIWEDYGTLFALGSLSVCWILRNLKALTSYTRSLVLEAVLYPLLFLVLVRISSLTGQCREEQFPDCHYIYSNSLEFGNHVVGYFSLLLMVMTVSMLGFLSRWLPNVQFAAAYLVSGTIVVLRMVQEIYLKNTVLQKSQYLMVFEKYMDVYLPRVVYGLCLIGTGVCICSKKYNKITVGWSLLLLWSTVLAIVQRPFASIIVLGSPILIDLLSRGSSSSLLIRLGLLHFLGHHLFFVTGHQATFTSLPWKAAFVGFDEMNYYGGMILVTLSTMAGHIISWIGMFILLADASSQLTLPLHLLTLLQSIPTFLCAIFILILRRHLMTWKIFAPRFLVQILIEVGAHLAVIALEKTL